MIHPARLALAVLAAGALLSPTGASAQSSQVSELWREWAVLEKQWRLEQSEVEADRRRLRARRHGEQKAGARPKGSGPKPAGR